MSRHTITILGSGVALGVYIPALLVNNQLKKYMSTDLVILEELYPEERQVIILRNKKEFHQNFKVALMGQRMAKDIRSHLADVKLDTLFKLWEKDERSDFLVFSGFWMSLLDEYRRRAGKRVRVYMCRMDAGVSTSWKAYRGNHADNIDIWLFNYDNMSVCYRLQVKAELSVPYDQREERLIVHGGGWGIGTYQNAIPELERAGFALDIVVYQTEEATQLVGRNRYFMMDPNWISWHKNDRERYEFPPFGQMNVNGTVCFKNQETYHELYDIISHGMAIVSKPGGSTLVDSLSSRTPLITLEPFGNYEKQNAQLWEHLGFGIPFEKWKKMNFSREILKDIQKRLRSSADLIPDLISSLSDRLEAAD